MDFEQFMGDIGLVANVLNHKYQMKCNGDKIWIVNVSKKTGTNTRLFKEIELVRQRSYICKMRWNYHRE